MNKLENKTTKQTIYEMLIENTGEHFLDSGGAYGRNHERNKGLTLADFEAMPEIETEIDEYNGEYSVSYTINLFHWLSNQLELDHFCNAFNRKSCDDWDSEFYGVSLEQFEWLKIIGFQATGGACNSYNYDSNLSQVIQWQGLKSTYGDDYILLQIHGGCDVRGGYTDAKLFKLTDYLEFFGNESVYGTIDNQSVSNFYNGYSLTIDDDNITGETPLVKADSVISLNLSEV